MVIYGYVIDLGIAKWPTSQLEETTSKAGIDFMTGYSVGAYTPEMAVLGVKLDSSCELFDPIRIDQLILSPTDEQKELLKNFDVNPWKEFLKYPDPTVCIWVDDDD